MNQKTLFKLEYDKIIALLEKEATSFRGGQLCRRLKPMTDINKINTFQEQTAAAFTRIVQKGRISFGDAAPVEESMKRLEVGGALSISELLRISRLLGNAARVKADMIHRKNPVTVWMLFLNSLNRLPLWQMRLSGVSPGKMKSVMMQAPH